MRTYACALLLAAAGCSDTGISGNADLTMLPDIAEPPADMTLTVDGACSDAAAAVCARIAACEPWVLQYVYGDQTTCATRIKLSCTVGAGAKGLVGLADATEACAQALPSLSCPDLVAGNLPAACAPMAGTNMNGLPCAGAAQCASQYCAAPKAGGCGACGPKPMAGASCATLACGSGLACAADNTCEMPVAQAGNCDGSHPCAQTLDCVGPGMPNIGTCQALAVAGANCDTSGATAPHCDLTQGVFCRTAAMSTKGTCAMIGLAKTGEPCGLVNGGLVVCQAGGHCGNVMNLMGTCDAAAADGAACDPQNGPSCLSPAVCAGGVCRIPDPTVCG